jgi:hypothetical protein
LTRSIADEYRARLERRFHVGQISGSERGSMNRVVAACIVGILGSLSFACSPPAVGDPCTPEREFASDLGGANASDLSIDVNSVQCETRVCLQHYFQGRVSCPYGNDNATGQTGQCRQVGDRRGLYRIGGTADGALCCPILGDKEEKPIKAPVSAQCTKRDAHEAVYCSCRCDVPDDPEIDKSLVQLCECPSGFTCKPLCGKENCGLVPKGKWGSYCVRDQWKDYNPDRDFLTSCGPEKKPPAL